MESCLYAGVVHHERLEPVRHRFQYRVAMAYLDLTEVPDLLRLGLLSEGRFASGAFLRRDHFEDPSRSLGESVRARVLRETGLALDGPIRLLTRLRHLGRYFSPLNLFFCFAADGRTPAAVVAEVQNIPWLERHSYVLWRGNQFGAGAEACFRHPKAFHVSPFMGMDLEYRWRLSAPGERLRVAIENTAADRTVFRAALNLDRVPLSRRTRWAMLGRAPLSTARITAAIYFQAFRLWRKRCPFYPHPKHHQHLEPAASGPHAPAPSPASAATD